jgi:hexulose-6-phosphate isomerase
VIGEQLVPVARDLGVRLAIDKIWDGFLVGPSEVARYVDAFQSSWVSAAVDLSSTAFYTRPRDWVRVLGSRVVNVRVADRRVDLAELRGVFEEISYDGLVTISRHAG